jgi:hypothetical protein
MSEREQADLKVRRPSGFGSIFRRGIQEGRKFLVITLYLWVILGLFALHKSILLPQRGFIYGQGIALLNALVLGKVMFFAESAHLGEDFETRPLVYPVLFKSGLFAIILIGFHLLEEVVRGALHGESISASVSDVAGGTLEGILAVGFMVFFALIPFFAFREVAKLVGADVMRELLFTRRRRLAPVSERDGAISVELEPK